MCIEMDIDNLDTDQPAPLFVKYARQNHAQSAYVQIDSHGVVTADYSVILDNGKTSDEFHQRVIQVDVSSDANGRSLANILNCEETKILLTRIHRGHEIVWDGNIYVGKLDADAQDAMSTLGSLLQFVRRDGVCEAADYIIEEISFAWFGGSIDEAVQNTRASAAAAMIKLSGNIRACLLEIAEMAFHNGDVCLTKDHLDALVDDGRIAYQEAQDYLINCSTYA